MRNDNCGDTRLKKKRRMHDPMQRYDRLPAPLRMWMSQAARPWSPESCFRIWQRAIREGATTEAALNKLNRIEQSLLARDAAH